jgi:hypothetical protein
MTPRRTDLINFVEEQIIGPGINKYRFYDFNETEKHFYEILDNAPASFYSSGILFPQNHSNMTVFDDETGVEEDSDGDSENQTSSKPNEEIEPSLGTNYTYPSTMGLSFIVEDGCGADDISINLSCRYYRKMKSNEIGTNIGVKLDDNYEYIISIIESDQYLSGIFGVKKANDSHYLVSRVALDSQTSEIRDYLKKKEFACSKSNGSEKDDETIARLLIERMRRLEQEKSNRDSIYNQIVELEKFDNFHSAVKSLLYAITGQKSDLWKSEEMKANVRLPLAVLECTTSGKNTFLYANDETQESIIMCEVSEGTSKSDVMAALSVNFEVGHYKSGLVSGKMIKVQVLNTSPAFIGSEGKYFSAWNDQVNKTTFFDVCLSVESPYILPIKEYRADIKSIDKSDIDEQIIIDHIYSGYKDYARGHGCSARWQTDDNGISISSTYTPFHDVPIVDTIPRDGSRVIGSPQNQFINPSMVDELNCLRFKWLSNLSNVENSEIIYELNKFLDAYESWIVAKDSLFSDTISKYLLDDCTKDLERMRSNVKMLEDDTDFMMCFRLMNSAMFMQIWHANSKDKLSEILKTGSTDPAFSETFYTNYADEFIFGDSHVMWRPFQLAFILLNIDGLKQNPKDKEWAQRNELVDLVWFPTGGGKTEAYLGIIALSLLYRRVVHGDKGGGTGVIMRYTLRLLTIQQFQRATIMIMALELIRRGRTETFGLEPIYIGLWVGQGSLPNKFRKQGNDEDGLIEEYDNIITQLRGDKEKNVSYDPELIQLKTKLPVLTCPWCGTEIYKNYHVNYEFVNDSQNTFYHNRVILYCNNDSCCFSEFMEGVTSGEKELFGPIPISICDEEIYQHPPALLFGTVDKFAQLAHKVSNRSATADSRRLFGRGKWEQGKPVEGYFPPDLIIQDELHLLSGPLGTATALAECAVDQLCSRTNSQNLTIRPKIISSTATTRNTEYQVAALFDRDVSIFPKPGPTDDDSFFAYYRRDYQSIDDIENPRFISKRKYMGIFPTGKTHMWMQMRLAAVFLVHRALVEKEHSDNRVAYEPNYEKKLEAQFDNYHSIISYFNSVREVGKTESQINTYLAKDVRIVFNRVLWPGYLMHPLYTWGLTPGELTGRLSGEEVREQLDLVGSKFQFNQRLDSIKVPEFIVATNMISVGLDISRLNAIIINSMPRSVSEYIQSSSRIGRQEEGVVFTLFHPYRTRDVSYYEEFNAFHEKFYSSVEPLSVTPFTVKAMDRFLGLYISILLRHLFDGKYSERGAAELARGWSDDDIDELVEQLSEYFVATSNRLKNSTKQKIVKRILQEEDVNSIKIWMREALVDWRTKALNSASLVFNHASPKSDPPQVQLFERVDTYRDEIEYEKWLIPQSMRTIEGGTVVKVQPR